MTTSLQFIKKLSIALLIIILLLIILAWILLRGSMPQYNGVVNLAKLTAPVVIERDSLGSATLHAQDRLYLLRALGYVHAQERFFEMDLMRRHAAGEMAEIFGSVAIPADRKARKFRMRTRALVLIEQLPIEQQQLLNAYSDGVNNGLNNLSIRPYADLLTRTHPVAWRNEDSLLVILAMFITLNESSLYRELALSTMHATLPEAAYQFLTASGGTWDAPLTGKAFDWPQPPTAKEINLQTLNPNLPQSNVEQNNHNMPGSNSFAVSGALTGGAALVANDMHLALRVPNIWLRTRLIYPKQNAPDTKHDVTGISLPGTPIMIVGSNRHIAWSFTNSYGDFSDWVRVQLDPEDSTRYRSVSGWKSLKTYREVIHVRDAPNEALVVHETEWGPILATDHDETPLALVWTALQPDAINFRLTKLEQVETAGEAVTIVQNRGMPTQNIIVGDKDGNIVWTIAGRIPKRTGNYNPQLPSDWTIPNTGWNGWLNTTQYPLISNPTSHRLWTANARTVTGTAFDLLGDGGYDLGARAKQIRDNLFARNQFTPADMQSIQLDHRALFLTRWRQLFESVLNQSSPTPSLTKMQQSLLDWDGLASTTSVAYLLVHTFRQQVVESLLDGFATVVRNRDPSFNLPRLNQTEHAIWTLIEQRPTHLLPPGYSNWKDFLHACAKQVPNKIQGRPEGINAHSWGEYNQARIHHPLSRALPKFIANWLNMPANALAGDKNMPRVQTPTFGASQRSVVAPGNEEQGYFDMPGGQSGHPLSPYYGSGHANWVTDKPTPFLPGPPEKRLELYPSQ